MEGKTISGYTIQRRLGTGGMAEVWYAENRIGKTAAVKILLPELCRNNNIVERFLTEAKTMVMLEHPNIRKVYDYGEIDGCPAIVMEYLDGDDLKERMKRGQHFTEEELIKWWNQLVDALNYTHSKGIVHRDIKPGNIFVDKSGNIKLLDFGIAKVRESISSTQTGQKIGTLMYMSPEQVKDSKHIDYHTDIYSLAVTFVHLVTGRKPYDSDTSSDFEIQTNIVTKQLDLSKLPDKWRNFLLPYLNKEASQRPDLRYYDENAPASKPVYNDEATIVDEGPAEPVKKIEPEKKERPKSPARSKKPEPSENSDNTKKKSKLGLWIALGAAAVVVALVALFTLKSDDKSLDINNPIGNFADDEEKITKEKDEELMFPVYKSDDEGRIRGGYANLKGEMIVEPYKYDNVWRFSEGMAIVNIDDKYGYINKDGKEVVYPKYDRVSDFYDGLALVKLDDKWGYIDKTGKQVVRLKYDEAYVFSDGMAVVNNDGLWGFVNKSGKEVIEPQYDNVLYFSEGLAAVKKDGKYGFIDKKGKVVIPFIYDEAGSFCCGLANVAVDGEWGYIDKSANVIVDFYYDDARVFNEKSGMARVKKNDKWGYVNSNGELVNAPKYTDAKAYCDNGMAAVFKNGRWGFIDKKGNFVIGYNYDVVRDDVFLNDDNIFYTYCNDEDVIIVGEYDAYLDGYKYGFIDKKGNYLVRPRFDAVYNYKNGIYLVNEGGVTYYVDKYGDEKLKFYIE